MEGDWITLALFLFIFIILPLLQGLRRRREGEELPEAEDEWQPAEEERAARARRVEPEEWADWDQPEVESRPAAERSAWEELGLDDLFRSRETPPRPTPEPAPPPQRPTPRWEEEAAPRWEPEPVRKPRVELPPPPLVLRPEQSQRAARRTESLGRATVQRRLEAVPPKRQLVPPSGVAQRPAPAEWVLRGLHDAQKVRRAIVLAEILGSPRSLQQHETRH
jgi:hypothetical protein